MGHEKVKTRHNLLKRGDQFYYRGSFTLNRKVVSIRLALKTSSLPIARERAARFDRVLRQRWCEIVDETTDGLTELDKLSILRAAALGMRDSIDHLHLLDQIDGYDDEAAVKAEQLTTIRAMALLTKDVHDHGIGPGFGKFEYLLRRFVKSSDPGDYIATEVLERLQDILESAPLLTGAMTAGPIRSLVARNIPVTDMNIALARRQSLLGILAALREAEVNALRGSSSVDDLLAGITMPTTPPIDMAASTAATSNPTAAPTTPVNPTQPEADSRAPARNDVGDLSIAAAAAAFLDANPKLDIGEASSRWTSKTRSQFDAVIFLATKFFEQTPIAQVDEDAIARFFRALRRLPRNHHKTPAHAGLSLDAIGDGHDGPGLSLVTTNRHMRFLRMVFDWVARRVPNSPVINWSAFVEADGRVKRDKRPAFTQDELRSLFKGAVWTGSESRVRRLKPGRIIWQDSAYWVPVMLTYTGCRREEVAKAMVTDIEQIDGIWALRVRDTVAGRVKTASSERDIPIADELIRLGFLDFVARQREAGETLLFPELVGGASFGDVYYKKWWRAFMRAGLVPEGKDIHSIRHFVSTELAVAGVSEERRADLLGHAITSSETARTYTKRTPLPILRDVVNKIPRVTASLRPI